MVRSLSYAVFAVGLCGIFAYVGFLHGSSSMACKVTGENMRWPSHYGIMTGCTVKPDGKDWVQIVSPVAYRPGF